MNPTVYVQHYYRCTPRYYTPDDPGFNLSSENSDQFNGALKFYIKAELHVGICPYHLNWRIPIDVPL